MRKVGIRKFRARIAEELRDLPFALTSNGEPVAFVVKPGDPVKAVVTEMPKKVIKKPRLSPMVEEVVIDESPMGGAERKAKISEMQSQMDQVTGSAPEFRGGYSKDRQTGKKEKK